MPPHAASNEWESLLAAAHAWRLCPFDILPGELETQCLRWLAPDERDYRAQLRTQPLKHAYLATRALCRATLSRYTGVAPVDWKFVKSAHGKPSIAEPAEFSSLQFNLTRTDGLIVCLVSRAGEVGVDAEETSRPVDIAQVARHFFSAKEQASLAACAPERRGKRFFEQWVLKEAYLKGRGTGLSETPPMLTIELGNDGRPMPVDDWQLALHDPSPQHVAATAIRARRGAPAIPISWFDALGLINARVAIVGGRVPDIRP